MSIYRGVGGTGASNDQATLDEFVIIRDEVDADRVVATTKASEASTSASNAATSATNASNSASGATSSATSASDSASTATTKASEASTSASTASTKAGEASTSASGASTSASNASTSASGASTSASNASTSASGAATSASNASTSASGASTSASGASTSASGASTSASGASTSATNAASSATDAQSALSSTQAVYDDFDDRFLGAKSSAPSVDNDGAAILTGAMYFNSSTDKMQVWDGSSWVGVSSAVSGLTQTFKYVATAGQTAFVGNDANSVSMAFDSQTGMHIFLNGVKLILTTDYTVNTGTNTVTLGAGALVGDLLEVSAFSFFQLSDTYTQAQIDAKDALLLPKGGGAMTGAITTNSTFDGRDVATDGSKLDNVETNADVTDAANVTAAGALMDSEVTNLAAVKAFDTTDYATAAQGTTAGAALPKAGGAMSGTITNFASTGIDDNSNALAITIDSSENVGIGTSSPSAKFDVEDGGTTTGTVLAKITQDDQSSHYGLSVGNDTYSTTDHNGIILHQMNSGHGYIYNGGSVNVGFPVAGGMTFGADTAAANALDDYEEGTWTITMTGSSTAGSPSHSTQNGSYIKIGNQVTISWYVSVSALGGATGQVRLSLPFTAASDGGTNQFITTGSHMYDSLDTSGRPHCTPYISHGNSSLQLYNSTPNGGWIQQGVDGSFSSIGGISYRAA